MLRVGLTGGIGSGKTTVARIFEVLAIPVYYADETAKRMMNEDQQLVASITSSFGKESYTQGTLNRSYLAQKVFNDPQKLALLNSIVHPATIADGEQWMIAHEKSVYPPPFAIKEAALIFESNVNKKLDYVIGVEAPLPLRIQRAMKRDGLTEDQVMSRINRQMDETEKLKLCDFILVNNEEILLIPQVIELHKKLTDLNSRKLSA